MARRWVDINLCIPEELDRRFRRCAYLVFGMRRGSLKKAVEAALTMWVKHVEEEAGSSLKLLQEAEQRRVRRAEGGQGKGRA